MTDPQTDVICLGISFFLSRARCLSRPTDIYNTDRQLSQFTDCGSHSVLSPRPDILQSFISIDSALPVLLTHLPAFTAECVHCRYSPTDNDCPQDTFVSARVYYLLATLLLIFPRLSSSVLALLYLSMVLLTGGGAAVRLSEIFYRTAFNGG